MKLDILTSNIRDQKFHKKYALIIAKLSKMMVKIPYLNIKDVAKELKCSTATLSRLINKIGFDNYQVFKYWCIVNSSTKTMNFMQDIFKSLSLTEKSLANSKLYEVIKKLLKAKKIAFVGGGISLRLANTYSSYFQKINIKSFSINGDTPYSLNSLDKDTFIIVISNTGTSVVLSHISKIISNYETNNSLLITTTQNTKYKEFFKYHLYGSFLQSHNINFVEVPIMGGYILKYILDKIFITVYNKNEQKNAKYLNRLEQP